MKRSNRMTRSIRNVLTLLALGTVVACASDATGPGLDGTYDLRIEVTRLIVGGDCETDADNPGEITYRLTVSNAGSGSQDSFGTPNYPSEAGALSMRDNELVDYANANMFLRGIRPEERDRITLTLSLTEHDPDGPDPDLNDVSESIQVRFSTSTDPGLGQLRSGTGSRCTATIFFRAHWTAG